MYRVMQCVKSTLEHPTLGPVSSFRQSMVGSYPQYRAALVACEMANAKDPQPLLCAKWPRPRECLDRLTALISGPWYLALERC